MWVLYGILPPLIVLALVAAGIVALIRGRSGGGDGRGIEFSGVLLGYASIAMLVAVFLAASGAALLLKGGLATNDREFAYDTTPQPQYDYGPNGSFRNQPSRTVDPSDAAIRDDVATGVTLAFVGGVLFLVHAFGAAVLRTRKAQGQRLIVRGYNLVGLATATIGFISAGALALNDLLRRYVLDTVNVQPWDVRHPGESLAFAVVLLPLVAWFGWRVWQEFDLDRERRTPTSTTIGEAAPA